MPFHKRLALHPLTLFLLLCVGVLLLASSLQTSARTSKVTMKISAPLPTSAAYITAPANLSRFSNPDITVFGTCPQDSYVKLYNNGLFKAVALCTSDGSFEIAIQLVEGANELKARVFNTTDDEGPESPSVTVFFDKPQPSGQPSSAPVKKPSNARQPGPTTTGAPFRLSSDYNYMIYKPGQPVTFDLEIIGGTSPYAIAIYWGDGHITPVLSRESGSLSIGHTYAEATDTRDYIIKVAGVDAEGATDFLQLAAVINGNGPATPAANSTAFPAQTLFSTIHRYLKYLWPAYVIFLLMVVSFWLGEREEWQKLTKRRAMPTKS